MIKTHSNKTQQIQNIRNLATRLYDVIIADAFSRLVPLHDLYTIIEDIRQHINYTNITPKTEHIIRILSEVNKIGTYIRKQHIAGIANIQAPSKYRSKRILVSR